jgi:arylsulfatase A-like enzyme
LLKSDAVRHSLDIAKEAAPLRDRYGRNTLGQSLVLARRLVESGVRFINVHDGVHNGQDANWDSHQSVFPRHRDHLIPPADQGLSALLEDLDTRGLLESTLVVAMGEFGRTPRINHNAGRDHWPRCYSVVLAGGGIRGGTVLGSSDNIGAYPATDPVSPGDLAATIYSLFGVDPAHEIRDITGRPWRLAEGRALTALL